MTNDGKLNGIDLTFYVDCGSSPNEIDVAGAQIWADNGTFCIAFWFNHFALEHRDCIFFFVLVSNMSSVLASTLTPNWINVIINSYSSRTRRI